MFPQGRSLGIFRRDIRPRFISIMDPSAYWEIDRLWHKTHIALSHLLRPINAASSPPAKAEFTMRDVTKDEVEADCAEAAVLLVNRSLMRCLLRQTSPIIV